LRFTCRRATSYFTCRQVSHKTASLPAHVHLFESTAQIVRFTEGEDLMARDKASLDIFWL